MITAKVANTLKCGRAPSQQAEHFGNGKGKFMHAKKQIFFFFLPIVWMIADCPKLSDDFAKKKKKISNSIAVPAKGAKKNQFQIGKFGNNKKKQ